ncbi:calcium channel protein [Stygiomarasmius scandens]|uniref:Calcium channel protein n=1 Tax=Marasmiellus scandens TaxID=2682957 RepID=A0ABR1J967_9AGAR
MSVVRTAIRNGTTTTIHSLKTARPLLASVAYLVVFSMVLFSILGIQSFNDSLCRSCFLLATDAEQELQISDQFCSGHVNVSTIQESNYVAWNGLSSDGEAKGYICPLGQICRETDNLEDGIQSFDTIWAAILQNVVVARANGGQRRRRMLLELHHSHQLLADEQDDGWSYANPSKPTAQHNIFKILYDHSRWIIILFALASPVLQATRTATVSETHEIIIYYGELVITLLFDVDILIRFLAALPDWRSFFGFSFGPRSRPRHAGGVGSTGSIRAGATPGVGSNWLDLILAVGSSVIQIPVIRNSEAYSWFTIFQLARFYRVILEVPRMRPLMLSVFGNIHGLFNMSLFLILINYIAVLFAVQLFRGDMSVESNMNFKEMFNAFLAMYQVMSSESWTDVLYQAAETELKLRQTVLVIILISVWELFANFSIPYRRLKPNPVKVKVENLPSNLVPSIQQDLVQEYREESPFPGSIDDRATVGSSRRQGLKHYTTKSLSALQKLFAGDEKLSINNDVLLATLKQHTRSDMLGALGDEETERHLELLASVNNVAVPSDDIDDAICERRAQKADFIHSAHGERIFGTPHSPLAHLAFQFLILLAVIGGIVTEITATPVYRRNYFAENGRTRGAWFDLAEGAFTLTFIVEFFIKICIDGFAFTPNAYIQSIWNIMDFIILAGISVNVATSLIFVSGLSRFTRSLKALRALRLITLFNSMRVAFQSLIIPGARILDAAGLNIFAGTMKECNGGDASGITDCINEYENSIFDDGQFGFPVPRVWTDPSPSMTYSFDNFRSSFFIPFEIVSLEGWIDVMNIAMGIAGKNAQPDTNASEWNALFFLITIWSWIDLQKLFKRQKPSKRPKTTPTNVFRKWCFDGAIHKHGWWSRSMTFLFVLRALVLTRTSDIADTLRNNFFLVIICVYIIDVVIRLAGLGWKSFCANGWNLFDILVAAGSFFTTLIVRFGKDSFLIEQLQKLFLVSIAFKLVQRTDSLNKLFKTSVASLPAILSFLVVWFIFFIYVEVFGLTKWGGAETRSQNYSTIGSASVMLAFMSTGEGWNDARVYPLCTNSSDTEEDSDCGSVGWAFILFIAWNILSMYIFVNLFTGIVVDSFSYVFQTSGGAKSITKKVWAEYANPKAYYLQ